MAVAVSVCISPHFSSFQTISRSFHDAVRSSFVLRPSRVRVILVTLSQLRRAVYRGLRTRMSAWRTHVIVAGRVVRVRPRRDGGWRVRLADTGGALAAAEFRPACSLDLPPVGAWIVLVGSIQYDDKHGWYAIDPVDAWVQAHTRRRSV